MTSKERKESQGEMKGDGSFEEQLPLNSNMALPYIKLRLATLNVRIQSLVSLMNKQNEKKNGVHFG